MQTFLPYADFKKTASVLDRQRLGKQRVETLQILRALHWPNYGWKNHPATLLWRDYPGHLVEYGLAICTEWINRGYNDSCYDQIAAFDCSKSSAPKFSEELHSSHRAALLKKDPIYYNQFGWIEKPEIKYIWK